MPEPGFWHWLPGLTVSVCWGLFVVTWLAGAIYNLRRSPAVRERSAASSPWLVELAAVLVLLVALKIRAEERLLRRILGAAHEQYRQQVPLLIPRLHK
jgi:protein-S-isoprenylcysteine O-methyltransferase Ste14